MNFDIIELYFWTVFIGCSILRNSVSGSCNMSYWGQDILNAEGYTSLITPL